MGRQTDIHADRQTSKVVLSAAFCSKKYGSGSSEPSYDYNNTVQNVQSHWNYMARFYNPRYI